MAKRGYCAHKLLIESAIKRYKQHFWRKVTPTMMYLEEMIRILQDLSKQETFSKAEILAVAHHRYRKLTKAEKKRYVKLAFQVNVAM